VGRSFTSTVALSSSATVGANLLLSAGGAVNIHASGNATLTGANGQAP
jgi:hypothetical protein